jgi:hypothetical protein
VAEQTIGAVNVWRSSAAWGHCEQLQDKRAGLSWIVISHQLGVRSHFGRVPIDSAKEFFTARLVDEG